MKAPHITHWKLAVGGGLAEIRAALSAHFRLSDVETTECRLEVLDDFGWDLWQDGRILCFRADGRLELYQDDDLLEIIQVGAPPRFWWDVPAGNIRQGLETALGLWSLAPIATISQRRSGFAIRNEDDKTVARLETMEAASLRTPAPGAPVDEATGDSVTFLTVRALRGYDDAACEAERLLRDVLGEARPRAGLRVLLSELGIAPEKGNAKPRFDLAPDEPAELAVRGMLERILRHARIYEPGMVADRDTEFLHQYRVSLRRARTLLSLMKSALPGELHTWLKPELAALARPTGPLRDLDVFMLERQSYRSMLPEEFHPGLKELFHLLGRDRTKALKAVLRSVTAADYSRRFEAVLQHISDFPAYATEQARGPIEPLARNKILQHYRKVRKRGEAVNAETPDHRVHKLRIECKKLRYLMEFFAEFLPSDQVKPAIKSLKGLQDVLGAFNDYSVQKRFLLALARRRKRRDHVSDATSGLVAVLHQRQMAERAKVQDAFTSFQSRDTTELFDALLHPACGGDLVA